MGFPSQRISEILLYVKHLPRTKNLQVMTLESSPWISPQMGFPDSQRISKIQPYVKHPSTTQKPCKSWHLNLPLESLSPQMGILDSQEIHWQQCPPMQSKLCFTNWSRTTSEDKYWGPQHTLISSKAALSIFLNNWARFGFLRPLFKFDALSSKSIRREQRRFELGIYHHERTLAQQALLPILQLSSSLSMRKVFLECNEMFSKPWKKLLLNNPQGDPKPQKTIVGKD